MFTQLTIHTWLAPCCIVFKHCWQEEIVMNLLKYFIPLMSKLIMNFFSKIRDETLLYYNHAAIFQIYQFNQCHMSNINFNFVHFPPIHSNHGFLIQRWLFRDLEKCRALFKQTTARGRIQSKFREQFSCLPYECIIVNSRYLPSKCIKFLDVRVQKESWDYLDLEFYC